MSNKLYEAQKAYNNDISATREQRQSAVDSDARQVFGQSYSGTPQERRSYEQVRRSGYSNDNIREALGAGYSWGQISDTVGHYRAPEANKALEDAFAAGAARRQQKAAAVAQAENTAAATNSIPHITWNWGNNSSTQAKPYNREEALNLYRQLYGDANADSLARSENMDLVLQRVWTENQKSVNGLQGQDNPYKYFPEVVAYNQAVEGANQPAPSNQQQELEYVQRFASGLKGGKTPEQIINESLGDVAYHKWIRDHISEYFPQIQMGQAGTRASTPY